MTLRNWWNAPPILDQFESIIDSEDVLELTEVYHPGPFQRFKQVTDAAAR